MTRQKCRKHWGFSAGKFSDPTTSPTNSRSWSPFAGHHRPTTEALSAFRPGSRALSGADMTGHRLTNEPGSVRLSRCRMRQTRRQRSRQRGAGGQPRRTKPRRGGTGVAEATNPPAPGTTLAGALDRERHASFSINFENSGATSPCPQACPGKKYCRAACAAPLAITNAAGGPE
jgi:hypothetical protein